MKKKIVLVITLIIIILFASFYGCSFFLDFKSKLPDKIDQQIQIDTKDYMYRKIFTISPKQQKSDKVILYFHGGAYMSEITENHWDFLQRLAKDTKTTIIVPDYPLTPKHTYKDVLKMSESIYKDTISKVENKNLILMGDSAGGGLALGLSELLKNKNIELPSKTILISPWLDIEVSNPEIKKVQPKDKDLNRFKLYISGALYCRGLKKEEKYFTSPIEGDLSNLKDITIFTGTYDILNPDCKILHKKAKNVGTNIEINQYETAPHIWIINNNDEIAKKAYDDLIIKLGE